MEEFRDIIGYEGLYQISNFGRVKSFHFNRETILKTRVNSSGYFHCTLSNANKKKDCFIHQLVAITFLNHTPCGHKLVVDHINDNKLDNRLENLQLITNRENTCKTQGRYSSKYKGVTFCKRTKKWIAQIHLLDKKQKKLGYFNCELQASFAYENKLKELTL